MTVLCKPGGNVPTLSGSGSLGGIYGKEKNSVFLAGGITDCEDWQANAYEMLKGQSALQVVSPRCDDFDVTDPIATEKQIAWEHKMLEDVGCIIFWFSQCTIQPITLFELGKCLQWDKPLFIGAHCNYERRKDIEIQVGLEHPRLHINATLEGVTSEFKRWRKHE